MSAVACIHRFGSSLNAHLHFHCAVIDGVFDAAAAGGIMFTAATGLDADASAWVQAQVRRPLLRVLARRGLLPGDDARAMAQWQRGGGFSVDGKAVCHGVPGFTSPPAASPPAPLYLNIPVRSEVASFKFTAAESLADIIPDPRRPIVDIAKCKGCHDGKQHGDTVVPRLSLHGNNRNENLGLCVICHNPNQTDAPYRFLTSGTTFDPGIGGPEVPVDFKVMVHSIRSGGFRVNPLVIVGFGSPVNDLSGVRFPKALRDCTNCHIDVNGKETFELPLKSTVLGTTVMTQSNSLVAPLTVSPSVTFASGTRYVSVNPLDDVKLTPTAATCSACHDKPGVKSRMARTGGASFATTQQAIGTTVKERCASCHGPGREEDVRRAHEIGGEHD